MISHLHVDHVAGLQGIIALRWFRETPDKVPLTIYGPPGTDMLVAGILQAMEPTAEIARAEQPGKWTPQASVKVVIIHDGSDFSLDGVRVRAVRNSHFDDPPGHPQDNGTQSLSFRFDYQGYAIGYTGDTGPSDAVASLERGVDLLVSEVTLRSADRGGGGGRRAAAMRDGGSGAPPAGNHPSGGGQQERPAGFEPFHIQNQHLSPETAAQLATAAGAKRLVFTHLAVRGATKDVAPRIEAIAKQSFRGDVVVAHDLDRF